MDFDEDSKKSERSSLIFDQQYDFFKNVTFLHAEPMGIGISSKPDQLFSGVFVGIELQIGDGLFQA